MANNTVVLLSHCENNCFGILEVGPVRYIVAIQDY